MRYGIMGGSFNPVHRGHLHAAEFCMQQLPLDEVWFIPAYVPPHKPKSLLISAYHRFAMIILATQKFLQFKALNIEIETSNVCFTIDTVKELIDYQNQSEVQFYFILGSDGFFEIQTWKYYKELLNIIYFVVLERNINDFEKLYAMPEYISSRFIDSQQDWSLKKKKNVILLPGKMLSISSSKIREYVGSNKNIDRFVSSPVARYIEKYELYK